MFTVEFLNTILTLSAMGILTAFLLSVKAYLKGLLGF